MIQSTVPPAQVNSGRLHATISEFWYVPEEHGEIWLKDAASEKATSPDPETPMDIAPGMACQYRSVPADRDLIFICEAMPLRPGG